MFRIFPLILLLLSGASAAAAPISGAGHSIDGDSLKVGDTEVRLYGIDAPELTQTCQREGRAWSCGTDAAYQLSRLVNGKQVSCSTMGEWKFLILRKDRERCPPFLCSRGWHRRPMRQASR